MSDHALLPELHQGGQGLAYHLVQVRELYVVDIDEVDVVDIQPFHALVYALGRPPGGIVPGVHSVLPVTAHLGRKHERIPRELLEGLAEHGLGLVVAVIGRYVDEVQSVLDCGEHSPERLVLPYGAEHSPERGRAETQDGHFQSRLS